MSKDKKPFSQSENHSYNVNVAMALGKPGKAVLLKEMYRSFKYFKEHNAKNLDGFYWFFLRMDAIASLYPEYTKTTMYRWVKEMEDLNIIASRSDLNSHKYDRTKWFTVNVFAYESLSMGKGLDWLTSQNENGENDQHSTWVKAITKMGIGDEENGTDYSQNELTIQPCLNPCVEPCLNPEGEKEFSLVLFNDELDSIIGNVRRRENQKEEKTSGKKEEKAKMIEDAVFIIGVLNAFADRRLPADPDGRGHKNVEKVVSLLSQKKKGKYLYTVEDLELVVQYKCLEWVGTDGQKWLRPSTLFGNRFPTYLDDATEAKDNPAFLAAVKRAKEADQKKGNGGALQASDITANVAEELKNW